MLVASFTSFVGDHSVYAVFALMAVAAALPVGSELVMVYAGALASGAFASAHVTLFGDRVGSAGWALVTVGVAGILGNLVGAVVGWAIGRYGGRAFLLRYGRYMHVSEARLDRAERWFTHYGPVVVPIGFAAPILRSFVAIPAGIFELGLARFVPLAAIGSAAFCFGLAGGGYALGSNYDRLHHAFTYVSIVIVALAVVVAAAWIYRARRSSRLVERVEDPAR